MPDDPALASWIQSGGVVAFAGVVLLWLRDYKREIQANVAPVVTRLVETMQKVETTLAALLERERARAERLAAQDAAARRDAGVALAPADEENTQPIATIPVRRRTDPGGYSYQRPRTKGDRDG